MKTEDRTTLESRPAGIDRFGGLMAAEKRASMRFLCSRFLSATPVSENDDKRDISAVSEGNASRRGLPHEAGGFGG